MNSFENTILQKVNMVINITNVKSVSLCILKNNAAVVLGTACAQLTTMIVIGCSVWFLGYLDGC